MNKTGLIFFMAIIFFAVSCKDENGTPGDNRPELRIHGTSVIEGNENTVAECHVSLSKPTTANVIIRYSTKDGTAKAGADFVAVTDGTVTIPAGSQETTIAITIIGDRIFEQTEHFEVIITSALNANVLTAKATVEIGNDDPDANTIIIPESGYITPTAYDGYELVWADEFDGSEINENNWTFETGTGDNGWGNNEWQYYRKENAAIHDNEYLVITAKEENFQGREYTSSRMITAGKKEFTFGRVDIRAALPIGKGIWPALWGLGANFFTVGWPSCGEIDIMEYLGHEADRVHGTAHWGMGVSNHRYKGSSTLSGNEGNFNQAFHVFTLNWEQDKLQWLVDDKLFYEITPADMEGQPYPFNKPHFFLINMAVGGNWPGYPDATTTFPQRFIVDYIRVFQK